MSLPRQRLLVRLAAVEGLFSKLSDLLDDDGHVRDGFLRKATTTDFQAIFLGLQPFLGMGGGNVLPVARAGADNNITLPTNSVLLVGSGTDSNGTIEKYGWAQISGPGTYSITMPSQASTPVTNLVQGVYEFELMVMDNDGGIGRDTVKITVNPAPMEGDFTPIHRDFKPAGAPNSVFNGVTFEAITSPYIYNSGIVVPASTKYPALFQYYAFQNSGGLEEPIAVPNGNYKVFFYLKSEGIGQSLLEPKVNNVVQESYFDIAERAGGANHALVLAYDNIVVTNGSITLRLGIASGYIQWGGYSIMAAGSTSPLE